MKAQKHRQSKSTVTIATLILSGLFAGVIVGPVFLYGQEPQTEGTTLGGGDIPTTGDVPANPDAPVSWDPSSDVSGGVWGVPSAAEQRAAQTGEFGTPEEEVARAGAAEAAARKAREDQAAELAKAFSCMGGGLTSPFFINLKGCLANLMDMVMWIAARTLWIAGVLLNMTLHLTLNLNTLLEQLPIVDIGWKVLRDIANIVFIFITLWAGISITLGIGDGGKKAWGLLAQMVLVALFINFSLFITKAIVDASNIAALHFYSLIVEPGKEKDYDSGLSEAFMYGLKLSTLYNAKQIGATEINADASMIKTAGASSNIKLSMTNIILIGFFGSLFIIVAAWVFFAAAIMFIYRAITLIMLMLLSPLAFVGLILPGASGMAHAWWSKLWSQAFFAPLYLALAYVVVRTINGSTFQAFQGTLPGSTPGTGFAAALTTTSFGPVSVIFNFVILIGIMVACLVVAQSLGAKGSEMAMAGWEKIKGVAVGGAIGVTGAAARGIIKAPSAGIQAAGNVGKAAKWMASTRLVNNKLMDKFGASKRLSEWGTRFQEGKGVGGKFGKYARKTGEWLDPRYLEERAGQSKWGNTMIGRAVRGVTTGAVANVKIGAKSLTEAYEEGEEMSSKRREIEYGHTARSNAKDLEPLQEDEQHKLNEKLAAEEKLRKAEEELKTAQTGGNPAEIAEKEKALGKGFADARNEHSKTEAELEKAKISKDPAKIAAAQAAVAAAKAKMDAERKNGGTTVEVAKAEEAVEAFEKANRETMQAYTSRIQHALGTMSTEAFLNLPKTFFENPAFMDHAVLGQDKYLALMKSEHFTKDEKEEYTKARWKRAEETAGRRKVRNDRYLAELPEYQKKVEEYQNALKGLASSKNLDSLVTSHEAKMQALNADLKDLSEKLADAEHDPKETAASIAIKKDRVNEKQKDIERERYQFEKEKAEKIRDQDSEIESERRKGRKDLIAPVMETKPPGWDEATDIRKALRNILRPDEVTALYRYNRKAFSNPFIADTIKQGTWNLVRNTGEIDSNSMEQARVIKRHYLKDSIYLGSGLDALQMHDFEEKNRIGAYALLDELGEKMKELGIEGYREFIESGELNDLLKQKGLDSLSASVDVQLNRHDAGLNAYRKVAPNLASNEFEMMPGMMREHPMSLNYYDQATITPFLHRDIENTLPIAEFYIEQFKRHVEGTGRISEGNLRILKWFINENQGQAFTQFEMIKDELKDWFEMIKRLIGKSNRAMTTRKYATAEDVYADMDRKVGRHLDPFDLIRSDKDKP